VLNEESISGGKFSFARKWTTIYDSTIDKNTRELFTLFGTEDVSEFDFDLTEILNGSYGVAPWSVSIFRRTLYLVGPCAANCAQKKHPPIAQVEWNLNFFFFLYQGSLQASQNSLVLL
jgi:hypothetical protein